MTYPPQGDPSQYPSAPPPGGGGYGYQQYPPQQATGNGLATAGMVCGIVGLIIANFILGPLAIIFGGIGLARANGGAPKRGQAIAALVLGVVDIIIYVIILVAVGFRVY